MKSSNVVEDLSVRSVMGLRRSKGTR